MEVPRKKKKGSRKPASAGLKIDNLENADGTNDKSAAKLMEIVQEAENLFFRKGYTGTTTRDIAKACGISPGHLYYYVKSKEDFPRIFAQIHRGDIDGLEERIRDEMKHLAPEEMLRKAVREYTYYIHLRRKMIVFWYSSSLHLDSELLIAVNNGEMRCIDMFRGIIELGCKKGQFDVSDTWATACNIHMLCTTWALKRWMIKDSRSIDHWADLCVESAVAMVHSAPSRYRTPK